MNLPTISEIEALHRKYAPTEKAFESVYIHCLIVAEIAEQLMASNTNVDKDVVRVGCLLHDMGVYRLYREEGFDADNYICHGILGEVLLRDEGFEERICRFASHHTGVGLTKEAIIEGKLPLPPVDYLAENEEELLVMYADKFHSKSVPPKFNSVTAYKEQASRFGKVNTAKFQEMIDSFGVPDLVSLSVKYGHIIV